jgi:hypothetical protein
MISMGIRELCGEVSGKDCIQIGDVVKVTHLSGRKHTGRLNKVSEEELKVGMSTIRIEEIIKIETLKP